MVYFSARPEIYDAPTTELLRRSTDRLLAAAGTDKTVLALHVADAATRDAVTDIVKAYFASCLPAEFEKRHGVRPALNLTNSAIRYQAPQQGESYVNWHLDLNFVLNDAPFLVCWTPLQDVGTSRSGLEICVPSAGTMAMDPILREWSDMWVRGDRPIFDDETVERLLGANSFQRRALTMPAGGGAIFDQYVLHRTQRLNGATGDRVSVEFRMVDLARLPKLFEGSDGLFVELSDDGRLTFHFKRRDQMHRIPEEHLDRLQIRIGSGS